MKKYNIFKVLLLVLAAAIIVSFLIPSSTIGYYTSGIEKGTINPINFVDSISNGLTSFSVFISAFIFILSIGVFYAVLKKTGKYEAVINNTAVKFQKKKGLFLVISILTFGIMTAVIGDIMPMLIFVPAFIDIAKKLGYDSKTSIASTVGAILLGSAGSLYTNYVNQIMSATVSSNIIAKIVILVLGLGSLILFTILTSKPEKTNLEKEEVKKGLPMMIAFDVIIVFLILGMVSWNGYFGFEGFTNFHKTLTDFKVFDVSLFNAILGSTLTAFGEWTLYNVIVLLVVTTVILSLIYKIKFDGLLESIASGIRRALPYAMIVILANLVLVGVYNSGFYTTIITSIAGMTDKVLSGTTLSALSSVVYPDYTYATQFTLSTITYTITDTKFYLVLAVIFQVIYSLFLLISPTSILVLLGLQRENVSYKEWIKYIYKYFLGLLIVFFVLIMVVGRNYISALSYVVLAVVIVMLVLFVVLSVTRKDTKKQVKKEKVEVKEEPVKKDGVKFIDINWYPGHMAKTKRQIKEKIDLIDIIYEVVDSRIPISSKIKDIDDLVKNKPRILIMTKSDLCDLNKTNKHIKYYESIGYKVVLVDLISNKNVDKIKSATDEVLKELNEKREAKGLKKRNYRALIIGIPNVGKSTLINRLAGKKVVGVGNKPGVTKQLSWIRISKDVDLMDSPGILWPKIDDEKVGLNLACFSAIKEEILPIDEVACYILKYMFINYKENLKERYGLENIDFEDFTDAYEVIGRKRGCILRGNEVDYDKVSALIVRDLNEGHLGKVTFDE